MRLFCTVAIIVRQMVIEIFIDVKDYIMFYLVAVFALAFFSIANMPYNQTFTATGQPGLGVIDSMTVAFKAGVLGDYDMVGSATILSPYCAISI